MNAPISRSSAMLLIAGAVAILLLGAFARVHSGTASAPVAPAPEQVVESIQPAGQIQLPPNLSPGLAEIIRMAQAHVDESVIVGFIHNSGVAYAPTADELLYLSDLGLSQNVLAALFPQKPTSETDVAAADAPPPPASSPAAPLSSLGTNTGVFYNALAPYGNWTQVPDYGLCWQPAAEIVNSDWRPYVDDGQWLSTDNGWYWQSGYSWGWMPFHYGRWIKTTQFGWVWVPGNEWGPAWVSWRVALNYSGWAPLPPGAGLTAAGLTFDNRHITAQASLGLPAGWFTFVPEANFLSANLPNSAVAADEAVEIYNRSLGVNNYYLANQIVTGPGPRRPSIYATAGIEALPVPMPQPRIPARKIEPLIAPRIAPENDGRPLAVQSASVESIDSATTQSADALAPSLPQDEMIYHRRHLWAADYAAAAVKPGPPRWPPPAEHEFFHRDQIAEPLNEVPRQEPPRLPAPMASTGSKAGK